MTAAVVTHEYDRVYGYVIKRVNGLIIWFERWEPPVKEDK